jgi:PAS domain S-box-containing protein
MRIRLPHSRGIGPALIWGWLLAIAAYGFLVLAVPGDRSGFNGNPAGIELRTLDIARAVDFQLSGVIRQIDFSLRTSRPGLSAAAAAGRLAGMPETVGTALIDQRGQVEAGFGDFPWAAMDIPARDFFLAQREAETDQLFIGRSILIPTLGRSIVVLSRRLTDAQGRFAGLVTAALDSARVREFLETLLPAAGGLILIQHRRGETLFRSADEAGLARNPALFEDLRERLRQSTTGSFRTGQTAERSERRIAFRQSEAYPLVVLIVRGPDSAAAGPNQPDWHQLAAGSGFVLLLFGLLIPYHHQHRLLCRALSADTQSRQRELDRLHARLNDAERMALLGHWERDPGSDHGYWSPGNFRIFGWPLQDRPPSHEAFLAAVHPEDRVAVNQFRERTLTGDGRPSVRYRIIRPDGTVRHLESQAEIVRDPSGRAVRLIGTTHDITDQVLAESRLRENEEKYRQVFELAHDAMLLIERRSRHILDANRAAQRIYGYEPEEFQRLTLDDLAADYPITTDELPARKHRRRDGTSFYVEISAAKVRLGERTLVVLAVRDVSYRVAAEARLARTTARLSEAERIAHLGHWEWQPAADTHVWSEELFRILGFEPDAIAASWSALLERVHPEDRARLAALSDQLGQSTDLGSDEVRVVRPDGGIRHLQVTCQIAHGAAGEAAGLFGTALDVTEHRQIQQALAESHAALSAVINATRKDAVILVDHAGLISVANERSAAIFDRPAAEVIGQPLARLLPADVARRLQAMFDHVMSSGRSAWSEEVKDGTVFDTHYSPALDGQGRIIGAAMFARDITQRKRVEDNLRKLSRAIEQSPLSIVITDLAGTIEYVNPHFCRTSGYAADEVIGRNPRMLKSGYTTDAEYRALWGRIMAGQVWQGEFHNRRKNGELYWELASIAPVRNERGAVTHYVAVKEDITRRKQAEIELLAAKERAEAASLSRSQFLAAVSHELRTPLNAIIGFSDCLADPGFGGGDPERLRRCAINIHDAGRQLLKQINEILEIARSEAGQFQLQETIFDAGELTLAVLEMFRSRAEAGALALAAALPDPSPLLLADERAVRQILITLLANAIKFTPAGGKVTASIGEDEAGLFFLAVADTGAGIAAERVGALLQAPASGGGSGLSLCRSMAEMHGGHLELESQEGAGTVVTVRLPQDRIIPGIKNPPPAKVPAVD